MPWPRLSVANPGSDIADVRCCDRVVGVAALVRNRRTRRSASGSNDRKVSRCRSRRDRGPTPTAEQRVTVKLLTALRTTDQLPQLPARMRRRGRQTFASAAPWSVG